MSPYFDANVIWFAVVLNGRPLLRIGLMSYTVSVCPEAGTRESTGTTTGRRVKSPATSAVLIVVRNPPLIRRKYVKPTETRGISSCWMLAVNSQFHGRRFQPRSVAGSCVVDGSWLPNPVVSQAPHSPLASELVRSQSGRPLLLRSVTVRATLVEIATAGFSSSAVFKPSCTTPRAADALIAVLPLPNRSYEKPKRGSTSCHLATCTPGNDNGTRFGRYGDGPGVVYGSYDSLWTSRRSAPLSVSRRIVQRSCR